MKLNLLFWALFLFMPIFGIIFILLVPFELELYPQTIISGIIAMLFTKLEIIKGELENKIFELKDENTRHKTEVDN